MAYQNIEEICSIAELASLFERSGSIREFLQTSVSVIAYHMRAAVCSIYLYDEHRQRIVLRANQGLDPSMVGKIELRSGEGIVGTAFREMRTLRVARARESTYFKPIPGSGEERYEAFLAVPIMLGTERVGVLVVQDPQADYFTPNDARALKAIAAQIAGTMDNARLFMNMGREEVLRAAPQAARPVEPVIQGEVAVPGIASGRTFTPRKPYESLLAGSSDADWPSLPEDFERALATTEQEIKRLQRDLEEKASDVASMIFSAHLMILKDDSFSGAMRQLIEDGMLPHKAIVEVINKYVRLFSGSTNPHLREKTQDVKDLGHRLLSSLRGAESLTHGYEDHLIVATDLLPSDIMRFAAQGAEGLILSGSGSTSHVAILARSLGLPTLLLDEPVVQRVPEDTPVILDANQGNLYISPSAEIMERYGELLAAQQEMRDREEVGGGPVRTSDGVEIRVLANINLISELQPALRLGADGVGLYRSEFPFIVRNDFPPEEEQYRIYRKIISEMQGREVLFRTLDIGGDKMLSYFPHVTEANPFLGLRAIRFSLHHKGIFSEQIRAMLRAGHGCDLKIMFPLVSSVDDYLQAAGVVKECLEVLRMEGIEHNSAPKLGVMVELPSAVGVIEELAREADFISIGTNDLVQYMLAVDRTNRLIRDMYQCSHPAILRAIRRIVDAAARENTPLSLCGDAAADLVLLPFFVGAGLRAFSVAPHSVPMVRRAIQKLNADPAREHAEKLLRMGTLAEVNAELARFGSVAGTAVPPPVKE